MYLRAPVSFLFIEEGLLIPKNFKRIVNLRLLNPLKKSSVAFYSKKLINKKSIYRKLKVDEHF